MEEEELVAIAGDTKRNREVKAGVEYFCPMCHGSFIMEKATRWRPAELVRIGSPVGPARDVIASYALGYADENFQVW
ncbi:MAG: hypothetical protein COX66_14630 [Elusimicrobia bacterium CG_4_10_14_0_2_um_filter_63_34]|nr:MAG: hypothetical protein COX66_14630 [Elusimicrobia bacterium CG_4_10_14_0_2_um_filter_63_34]